jgi:hypothetical protein
MDPNMLGVGLRPRRDLTAGLPYSHPFDAAQDNARGQNAGRGHTVRAAAAAAGRCETADPRPAE